MTSRRKFVLFGVACSFADAESTNDEALARSLASDSSRASAVAQLESSRVPLLLSWTAHPPPKVDVYELNIGLADVFGKMRTKEAIPFLIKNISIDRTRAVNTWMKTPEVIEQRLAAVAALNRIGPDASDAIIRATWGPMKPEDRLAAVFAVARMDDPRNQDFFRSILSEAQMERYWAEEGLKRTPRKP